MNKSILIVICDFLVSAMLTMMSGMVPAHTGGTGVGLDENTTKLLLTELDRHRAELENLRRRLRETVEQLGTTPEREAELRRLASALAANRAQRENLEQAAKATVANTGILTPEELQRRLEMEKQRRMALEIELKDKAGISEQALAKKAEELSQAAKELLKKEKAIQSGEKELAAQRELFAKTTDALTKSTETVRELSKHNEKLSKQLANVNTELTKQAEAKLDYKEKELQLQKVQNAGLAQSLRNVQNQLGSEKGKTQTLTAKLAFTQGKLTTTEKNAAGLQDKVAGLEQRLTVSELEKTEARVQRDELQKTLKTAVTELSAARTELSATSIARTRAETRLEGMEKKLKEASNVRNDVISNYGQSVVSFHYEVAEERLLGEQIGKGTYFLPVVKFGNRNMVVGTLNKFAGDAEKSLAFRDVTRVSYHTVAPQDKAGKRRIASPMLVHLKEMRAAAFEYPFTDRTPLNLLTVNELKKRGTDDLMLFKCRSLGRESALLNGRCSISLEPGDNMMFIRNAGRANNELRAEPGDIILTKSGEFVGIVVDYDEMDRSRVRGVRALLFADGNDWQDAMKIPVVKAPGEKYYLKFASAMAAVRKKFDADSRGR